MAGGAAEVDEAALGEDDDLLAVGELDLVDLRLDLGPLEVASAPIWISLSKWPMLQTIAMFFIARMWSSVMTSMLPVAVTKMSERVIASSTPQQTSCQPWPPRAAGHHSSPQACPPVYAASSTTMTRA